MTGSLFPHCHRRGLFPLREPWQHSVTQSGSCSSPLTLCSFQLMKTTPLASCRTAPRASERSRLLSLPIPWEKWKWIAKEETAPLRPWLEPRFCLHYNLYNKHKVCELICRKALCLSSNEELERWLSGWSEWCASVGAWVQIPSTHGNASSIPAVISQHWVYGDKWILAASLPNQWVPG